MATIYKISSPCLQECYVGSTKNNVERRWLQHKNKKNDTKSKILIEKYGVDNCKFMVIEECQIEEQHIREQWWLDNSIGVVNKKNAIGSIERTKYVTNLWREANKEKLKQQYKVWSEVNKEKRNQAKRTHRANKKKENAIQ